MNITTVGIDLAKNVFQLHGVDNTGEVVLKKRLSRSQFAQFMGKLSACQVAMEACGSAHYWARSLKAMGHEVKLIAPQFVKSFVMGNKNDGNDARAICQARLCKDMRYVPIKTIEQQDIQLLHSHRALLVKQRTQLVNHVRGHLAEYGVIMPKQIRFVRTRLPEILDDQTNELSSYARAIIRSIYEKIRLKDEEIKQCDNDIEAVAYQHPECQHLMKIPGVGPKTATAVLAAIGNGHDFKNGRQFAAWCGLVPKQSSSGDRVWVGGITKRGNTYLRTLLIHGARTIMKYADKQDTPLRCWAYRKEARTSRNRTVVALANKQARVIWIMLTQGVCYEPQLVCATGP